MSLCRGWSGYATAATDLAIHANVLAAGYKGVI